MTKKEGYLNNAQFAKLAGVSRQAIGKALLEDPARVHKSKDGIDPEHRTNTAYLLSQTSNPRRNQNHTLRTAGAGHKPKQPIKINGIVSDVLPPENQEMEPFGNKGLNDKIVDISLQKANLEIKKLKEQIKKLEIDNNKKSDLSVPRDGMLNLMNKSYKVIVSFFHPLGNQLSDEMDSIYQNSDPVKTTKCIATIEEHVSLGLQAFQDSLEKEICEKNQ